MSQPFKLLFLGVIWLILLIFGGTLGYMLIEGADFLSSLFMTVITITTIGYQEYVPLSTAGRVFTIFLALGGVGFFFYMLSVISEFVVHLTLQTFEGRGMEKEILKLSDHAILCGFGRIGKNIYELIKEEIPVVVIEKDPELIKELKEKKVLHLEGDATEEEVLLKAGIKRARHLIAVLGEDPLNVYLVLSARMLNPRINIVSRADDPSVEKKLYQAGANRVLSPYLSGAKKMALAVLKPNVMDFIDIAGYDPTTSLQLEEILVEEGSALVNKTILESRIRDLTNAIILAIKRKSGEMIFNPASSTMILEGDILIALGERERIETLSDLAKRKG